VILINPCTRRLVSFFADDDIAVVPLSAGAFAGHIAQPGAVGVVRLHLRGTSRILESLCFVVESDGNAESTIVLTFGIGGKITFDKLCDADTGAEKPDDFQDGRHYAGLEGELRSRHIILRTYRLTESYLDLLSSVSHHYRNLPLP